MPPFEFRALNEFLHSYQYGPDTYLLQLRDTNFPVRLREYVKVATRRSPAFALNENSVDYSVRLLKTKLQTLRKFSIFFSF